MNSDSPFNYFELIILALIVAAWGILELQGKRLDRKREAERARQQKIVDKC
ncbi:MAG: hypothetical protein HXX15_01980 [Rhodopseudomonas sp.]|uniref:hypothetical protein n=1 Tax=Rhodopseudomonas sp. TaxID=1078 RepID=UPI0017EDA98A|nr:hypothetical protein [Rhodopseudomonas sp.]NVN84833.1 hypothetical protein [Rhodopseudomonas sp.]